jgi:hypothetical protein
MAERKEFPSLFFDKEVVDKPADTSGLTEGKLIGGILEMGGGALSFGIDQYYKQKGLENLSTWKGPEETSDSYDLYATMLKGDSKAFMNGLKNLNTRKNSYGVVDPSIRAHQKMELSNYLSQFPESKNEVYDMLQTNGMGYLIDGRGGSGGGESDPFGSIVKTMQLEANKNGYLDAASYMTVLRNKSAREQREAINKEEDYTRDQAVKRLGSFYDAVFEEQFQNYLTGAGLVGDPGILAKRERILQMYRDGADEATMMTMLEEYDNALTTLEGKMTTNAYATMKMDLVKRNGEFAPGSKFYLTTADFKLPNFKEKIAPYRMDIKTMMERTRDVLGPEGLAKLGNRTARQNWVDALTEFDKITNNAFSTQLKSLQGITGNTGDPVGAKEFLPAIVVTKRTAKILKAAFDSAEGQQFLSVLPKESLEKLSTAINSAVNFDYTKPEAFDNPGNIVMNMFLGAMNAAQASRKNLASGDVPGKNTPAVWTQEDLEKLNYRIGAGMEDPYTRPYDSGAEFYFHNLLGGNYELAKGVVDTVARVSNQTIEEGGPENSTGAAAEITKIRSGDSPKNFLAKYPEHSTKFIENTVGDVITKATESAQSNPKTGWARELIGYPGGTVAGGNTDYSMFIMAQTPDGKIGFYTPQSFYNLYQNYPELNTFFGGEKKPMPTKEGAIVSKTGHKYFIRPQHLELFKQLDENPEMDVNFYGPVAGVNKDPSRHWTLPGPVQSLADDLNVLMSIYNEAPNHPAFKGMTFADFIEEVEGLRQQSHDNLMKPSPTKPKGGGPKKSLDSMDAAAETQVPAPAEPSPAPSGSVPNTILQYENKDSGLDPSTGKFDMYEDHTYLADKVTKKKAIGYGHQIDGKDENGHYVILNDEKVYVEDGITKEQAIQLFQQDWAKARAKLEAEVGPEIFGMLPEQHKEAITEWIFNTGKPFGNILDALLQKDIPKAKKLLTGKRGGQWGVQNKVGGMTRAQYIESLLDSPTSFNEDGKVKTFGQKPMFPMSTEDWTEEQINNLKYLAAASLGTPAEVWKFMNFMLDSRPLDRPLPLDTGFFKEMFGVQESKSKLGSVTEVVADIATPGPGELVGYAKAAPLLAGMILTKDSKLYQMWERAGLNRFFKHPFTGEKLANLDMRTLQLNRKYIDTIDLDKPSVHTLGDLLDKPSLTTLENANPVFNGKLVVEYDPKVEGGLMLSDGSKVVIGKYAMEKMKSFGDPEYLWHELSHKNNLHLNLPTGSSPYHLKLIGGLLEDLGSRTSDELRSLLGKEADLLSDKEVSRLKGLGNWIKTHDKSIYGKEEGEFYSRFEAFGIPGLPNVRPNVRIPLVDESNRNYLPSSLEDTHLIDRDFYQGRLYQLLKSLSNGKAIFRSEDKQIVIDFIKKVNKEGNSAIFTRPPKNPLIPTVEAPKNEPIPGIGKTLDKSTTPTTKPPDVIKLSKPEHIPDAVWNRDIPKLRVATKFIGKGSPGSATEAYEKLLANKANTGQYTSADRVFISAEGLRSDNVERIPPDFTEIQKAIDAKSTIILDTVLQRNRKQTEGFGSREVADYLRGKDYVESRQTPHNSFSEWKPKGDPALQPKLNFHSPAAPTKIISGGQSGADLGGLDAAKELGIQTGGTAAAKWSAFDETGKQISTPEYRRKYGMKEGEWYQNPETGKWNPYRQRTIANAQEADGTIWFGDPTSAGGRLTLGGVAQNGKPLPLINPQSPEEIRNWMIRNNIKTLNVAGNREMNNKGIYERTKKMLKDAFGSLPNP